MKKKKREKLKQIKEQKRLEWERVKTLQDEDLATTDDYMIELDVDGMMEIHFMEGEYGCCNCEDFLSKVCKGEGYSTYDECYACMKEKFKGGDRIMMMTNIKV